MERFLIPWPSAALLVALAACSGDPAGPGGNEPVVVRLQADRAAAVAGIAVEVTAADLADTIVVNLTKIDGLWQGSASIPAGSDRTFIGHAYDANGIETHRGSHITDIVAGQNTLVGLTLAPLSGDVPIEVTVGTFMVTISPLADTIPIAGTATFSVVVRDIDGTVLTNPGVTWAARNPAVATVDTAGVATGHVHGSTQVVVNYEGVAAAAALVVE